MKLFTTLTKKIRRSAFLLTSHFLQ